MSRSRVEAGPIAKPSITLSRASDVIVVTGMHLSGGELAANLLDRIGVDMVDREPATDLPPDIGRGDLISSEYLELQKQLHSETRYGTSGGKWAAYISDVMKKIGVEKCLDYGCGTGQLKESLGSCVAEYDPCIPGKDQDPEPAELVVCTDVLEHIEPDKLNNVLAHLSSKLKDGSSRLFFTIALREAKKKLLDGRNAHLIIQTPDWWDQRLKAHFHILEWTVSDDWEVWGWARRAGQGWKVWERSHLASLHDKVFDVLGQPLSHHLHLLPLPDDWMKDEQVQFLKQDLLAYVAMQVSQSQGLWGFKDSRAARLLPLWNEIFNELNLRPRYVWTIRSPAQYSATTLSNTPVGDIATTAAQAEALWLCYQRDFVHAFASAPPTVVDYDEWPSDPDLVVERLIKNLELSAASNCSELSDYVRRMVADRRKPSDDGRSVLCLPISSSIYQAVRHSTEGRSKEQLDSCIASLDAPLKLVTAYAQKLDDLMVLERDHSRAAAKNSVLRYETQQIAKKMQRQLDIKQQETDRVAQKLRSERANIAHLSAELKDSRNAAEQLGHDLEQVHHDLRQVRRDLKQRSSDLEAAQKRTVKLTARLTTLQNSFSWKVTRPLRAIGFYWRQLFRYPIPPGPE